MTDAFTPGPARLSAAPLFAGDALLDAEKLDVYRIALEFQALGGQRVPLFGQCGSRAAAPTERSVDQRL